MTHDELKYRIAFSQLHLPSIDDAKRLIAMLGSERVIMECPEERLWSLLGKRVRALSSTRRAELVDKSENQAIWVEAHGVTARYFTESNYPKRLLECQDAPLMLYTLGAANLDASHVIGIVGTRNATMYGINFVDSLVEAISTRAQEMPLIISGLAYGIDGAAHKASLKYDVPTAGVLAHGLNIIYPAAHRDLASRMVRGSGAIITEYPAGIPIHRGNFLARNRIIAGMCDSLIVVESAERGGALVTARLASDYNREVYALPGRVSDRYCKGCNKLIHDVAAAPIVDVDTLLEELKLPLRPQEGEQQQLPLDLNPQEQAIVDFLTHSGRGTLAKMGEALGLPIHKMLAECINLEYKGLLQALPGGQYRLR